MDNTNRSARYANRGRMPRRNRPSIESMLRKEADTPESEKPISRAEDLPISKEGVYFLPLGGTGEFGLNMNLYYCNGKWIIVDIGVSFDGSPGLNGINVFMPKIDFLKTIPSEDILGIFITHGHEDHLGAVQYLWEYIKRPVYATPFTASLLRKKLKDMRKGYAAELIEVNSGEKVELGEFSVEYVNVTHSIPDNAMLIIGTKYGYILHTGDWRFDEKPVIGQDSDLERLKKLGKENVLAVIGDSTNAMTEGKFATETDVKDNLYSEIAKRKTGRVVVVCFSTNLSRVDSCARIGQMVGRRVVIVGRSMHRIKEVALENGYLKDVPQFLSEDAAREFDRDKLLIVCTGSQGEPNSGLRRLSENKHPKIFLEAGDTVIVSARMITGKEKDINDMMNKLKRRGIEPIQSSKDIDIHVSGHPAQHDLKTLYNMVKPKIVVPVHGEVRNLMAHRDFAKSIGFASDFIENGDFIYLGPSEYSKEGKVKFGQLGLDGKILIPRDGRVMLERSWLVNGCIFISIEIKDYDDFHIMWQFFGVFEYTDEDRKLISELKGKVDSIVSNQLNSLTNDNQRKPIDRKNLEININNIVKSTIFQRREIDPVVMVLVHLPEGMLQARPMDHKGGHTHTKPARSEFSAQRRRPVGENSRDRGFRAERNNAGENLQNDGPKDKNFRAERNFVGQNPRTDRSREKNFSAERSSERPARKENGESRSQNGQTKPRGNFSAKNKS